MRSYPIISAVLFLVLFTGCTSEPVSVEPDALLKEYGTLKRTGKGYEDPEHGKEIAMSYGAVAGVTDTAANGVAFVQLFEDGVSLATVYLNIRPVAEKKFAVWLTDEQESKLVYGSELKSIIGDTRHGTKFELKEEGAGLTKVLVTTETEETPTVPGTIIAEGTMKATAR